MTNKAALAGTYYNLRPIVGRKVFQVHVEIPIEHMSAFVKAFGAPSPDTWIALARMAGELTKEPTAESSRQASPHRRKWDELSYAERAGIRCGEERFFAYLKETISPTAYDTPADYVRAYCGVKSRAELNSKPGARFHWEKLEAKYQIWLKAAEVVA